VSPHTPGPWAYCTNEREPNRSIVGTEGGERPRWLMSILHNGELLPQQQEADARLIAAAPDLLKAMQDLFGAELEKCMAYDGHDDQMQAVAKARAAIAKATGEGA